MAYVGDTVRLKVHFKSFDGDSIDPDDITLTIYNTDKSVSETIPITDENKTATGQYYYDYVVSDELLEYFIFEFGGIHNNKPILSRDKVKIKFN